MLIGASSIRVPSIISLTLAVSDYSDRLLGLRPAQKGVKRNGTRAELVDIPRRTGTALDILDTIPSDAGESLQVEIRPRQLRREARL